MAHSTNKYRFHYIGLAHVPTSPRYNSCAFSQKMIKLCRMLKSLGHEVYFYGVEGSEVEATEFIQCQPLSNIRKAWGDKDYKGDEEMGYDWRKEVGYRFTADSADRMGALKYFATHVVYEIEKRANPEDFILVQGMAHKVISDTLGDKYLLKVEPGIGYRASCERFRCFESFFIMNYIYGLDDNGNTSAVRLGKQYDRVIPNYFDTSLYPFSAEKEDYYLYLGRLVGYKGVHIAVKTADYLNRKIYVAGQGEFESKLKNVEFVGYADIKKRGELMSHAKAVFVPTLYLEPFGGVAIEAMLCGTPVITTNFGAFPEYVINGFNGYRCDMFRDFVEAGNKLWNFPKENYQKIHDWAVENYDMENVKMKYQAWFDDLHDLYESVLKNDKNAWYKMRDTK